MSQSQFHRAMVRCPRCLNDIDAVIWDVIDASADPDLKERLLQKKVQEQECLNCGHTFILAEPLLYREDAHRLLVFYAPAAASPAAAGLEAADDGERAAAAPAGADGPLAAPDPSGFPGWHLRRVGDYNSLIETIHIHDHFCDDRLMAVVKVAIQTQGCLDPEPSAVFFLTADDTVMRFMARTGDDEWFSVDYPPDIYTNTEALFKDALPAEDGWLAVDTAYGAALVREQTARLAEPADGSRSGQEQ